MFSSLHFVEEELVEPPQCEQAFQTMLCVLTVWVGQVGVVSVDTLTTLHGGAQRMQCDMALNCNTTLYKVADGNMTREMVDG